MYNVSKRGGEPNLKLPLRAIYDGHWTWLSYKVVGL